jgi:hypothetical protein
LKFNAAWHTAAAAATAADDDAAAAASPILSCSLHKPVSPPTAAAIDVCVTVAASGMPFPILQLFSSSTFLTRCFRASHASPLRLHLCHR